MKKAATAAFLLGVLLPVAATFADTRGDRDSRPDRPTSTDVRPERPDRPAPPVE